MSVATDDADVLSDVVFDAIGAAAVTAPVNVAAFAGVVPSCRACEMTAEASAALDATELATLIPGADNAVVVATVGPEVAVGPGLVSVFPCGDVVTWPESVCEVAAIAAAAIASGGVEPPEVGVAAGVFVGAVLTESVTGTATGVVTVDCWA